MKLRRDSTRLIYEILSLAGSGASRYRLMCGVNLSFPLADNYISFLSGKGHLKLALDDHGISRYMITAKGERLLRFLREIQDELDGLFLVAQQPPVSSISRIQLRNVDENVDKDIGWR